MPDLAAAEPAAASPAQVLQGALVDSRQRWHELVTLAADLAFETDEWGRFTLIAPDPALDWPARALIGRPADALLAGAVDEAFDPFRALATVRHRRAWVKRADGTHACLTFCVTPIRDHAGRFAGTRGLGVDLTELDNQVAQAAATLRRSEVIDHILRRIAQEVLSPRMIVSALSAILDGLGAEGTGVLVAPTAAEAARFAYVAGLGAESVMDTAIRQLPASETATAASTAADGRIVLVAACHPRSGTNSALVAWRGPAARAWDPDDLLLVASSVKIVRMLLERDAIHQEMNRQARTDPLTGLLNRRAFLEEMERHAARQDRDDQPSTLMFADLDNFKPVNDQLGHETGDDVLRQTSAILRRTFRPTDLIARLGGDEFAIWMDGADHMTAAERAEVLRDEVPRELAEIVGPDGPRVSLSIGIACRDAGLGESLDNLMRRADRAMYEVKRGGRGHWRVSLRKRP
jgi:diguanylate cyclase (GGDEF)-like protein